MTVSDDDKWTFRIGLTLILICILGSLTWAAIKFLAVLKYLFS